MKTLIYLLLTLNTALLLSCATSPNIMTPPPSLRLATFNVSMEANNYASDTASTKAPTPSAQALIKALKTGDHPQIRNIAEIIQRVRPDIILLNEFDHIPETEKGIEAFLKQYLQQPQQGQTPIDYPYFYTASVNTGEPTPFQHQQSRLTHYGFGRYPGQYGMAVLSRYPMDQASVRSFQHFLWKDMPNHLMPKDTDGKPWYSAQETEQMRLSSKSHWDISVDICGKPLQILASHPTPPVFDGPEDRNGRRNHDELRFWRDYIEANSNSYHYDDQGQQGGLKQGQSFVILGDLNANDLEGQAYTGAMSQLLEHPRIAQYPAPRSDGGAQHKTQSAHAAIHTTHWGMRADYVLPSSDLTVLDSGVFWPTPESDTARLVSSRQASSDHRLVWVDVAWPQTDCQAK